jgi:hypothetical protein
LILLLIILYDVSKFGAYYYNKSITQFESCLAELKESIRTIIVIDLRNFVKSLDNNPIENLGYV